jgi:hypothetical protein
MGWSPAGHGGSLQPHFGDGQSMPARPEFAPVFKELREILAEYAPKLTVVHDRPDYYYLDTHHIGANKRPVSFGGVRIGKAYVSYYLMPVYAAEAAEAISPELKKRMQGKACFNFTAVDQKLFKELRQLTKRGYQSWKKIEWVD